MGSRRPTRNRALVSRRPLLSTNVSAVGDFEAASLLARQIAMSGGLVATGDAFEEQG